LATTLDICIDYSKVPDLIFMSEKNAIERRNLMS